MCQLYSGNLSHAELCWTKPLATTRAWCAQSHSLENSWSVHPQVYSSLFLNAKNQSWMFTIYPCNLPPTEGKRNMPSESPWSFRSTHISIISVNTYKCNSSKENIVFLVESQIQTLLGTHVKKTLRVKTKRIFEMLLFSDVLGTLVAAKFYKSFKEFHISSNICEHHEDHPKPKGIAKDHKTSAASPFPRFCSPSTIFSPSWEFTQTYSFSMLKL